MNLKDIIQRPNGHPVSQEEAIFVVQEYIKDKKRVTVQVNLLRGFENAHNQIKAFVLQEQLSLLFQAYIIASNYFIAKQLN